MKRSVVLLVAALFVTIVALVAVLAFVLGRTSVSSDETPSPPSTDSRPSTPVSPSAAPTRLEDGRPRGDLVEDQARIQCAEIEDPPSCVAGFGWGASSQVESYATRGVGMSEAQVNVAIKEGVAVTKKAGIKVTPGPYVTGFNKGTGFVNVLWYEQPW